MIQNAGAVTVRVFEYAQWGQPNKVVVTAAAPTLFQLRAEHPEDFRTYVLPMLGKFSDLSFLAPGPSDVYGAFQEIPADEKVTGEIEQLIPKLDADDPADRDAASAKLDQLGSAGVLAALRMDMSDLTAEQKERLRLFIAQHRRRSGINVTALLHDPAFLIDCLEFPDAAVRAAAKADLERLIGKSIAFDATLTGGAAATAADAPAKGDSFHAHHAGNAAGSIDSPFEIS